MPGACGAQCLGKGSHKVKKEVADDLRSIFYASSKEKAEAFYRSFQKKWDEKSLQR